MILRGTTLDQEIFMLKRIRMNIFCGVKFLRFRSIREFFLTVDGYDRDDGSISRV